MNVAFAAALAAAEDRLRATGLHGRAAFVALARHLARQAHLPEALWPDGADPPAGAGLDLLPLGGDDDLFGLAYERFFPDLFKGTKGQYFTPRGLVDLAVFLAKLEPGARVLDPTCGSGGFLVQAHRAGARVRGIEVDPDLATLARLNLARVGAAPDVEVGDFFAAPAGRVDTILANPPFSLRIGDRNSDALFIEKALDWLAPGGRLVTVMPFSLLDGAAYASTRALADDAAVREAVITLPEGLFRPFGGTATRACLVVLRRRPCPEVDTLYAVVEEPGFDPRRKDLRPTGRDDLKALREGALAHVRRRGGWMPERELHVEQIGLGVPATPLRHWVERPVARRPAPGPVVAFSDVDKATGEVVSRSAGNAVQAVEPGDLLFGKMRPQLNNVALTTTPGGATGEWLRLRPLATPHFVLVAARSAFARSQLTATRGQTRPRVTPEAILGLRLPDPGETARETMAQIVAVAHARRAQAREELSAVADLYDAFGRGEIDADSLQRALSTLAARQSGGALTPG